MALNSLLKPTAETGCLVVVTDWPFVKGKEPEGFGT